MPTRTFLHQLFSILAQENLNEWIYWTEDDDAVFAIKPYASQFSAKILKGYFKHGNVSSFVRQLHMYGFHKLSNSNNRSKCQVSFLGVDNSLTASDPKIEPESPEFGKYKEKMSRPALPQDRAKTIWYFTHPSGVFHKNAETSDLDKIHRKSNSAKDTKRKAGLTALTYNYYDTASMKNNKLGSGMYDQGYVQHHQQLQPPQKSFVYGDQYNAGKSTCSAASCWPSLQVITNPNSTTIFSSCYRCSTKRRVPSSNGRSKHGTTGIWTTNLLRGKKLPASQQLQGINTVNSSVQVAPSNVVEIPNISTSPLNPASVGSASSKASNNTNLPSLHGATTTTGTPLSQPLPTRPPIVAPLPNIIQTSHVVAPMNHAQAYPQKDINVDYKYNTLAKAVLTLTDIIDSISQSNMQDASTGRASQHIDYYKISQTLQLIRDDIIHYE
ncbi:hypothetical protein TPHA_0H01130 [Tetrapisispora phaffii CBS 4417]|uniref:HSF-type DNA-binding domain-containing protein n=1 Tax=Tetrapisispora phaffii (strain ATCC 24235 / CBS 4417 / NBRC 1672 / NRRL Y-8282 / UCD 70-5) TaxID=1071381 RepID=G8BX17_TETPH|nr:hypothetical protein TPHA_0H01130 [Tetrapisispora phaffii CBS 4417]CCE64321.1 hypothetical protein TPHA_0H01130 [Tetrapisispora phaffii CBS 4417]